MSLRRWCFATAIVATAVLVVLTLHQPGRMGWAVAIAWLWVFATALGALIIDQLLVCCGATWQLPLRGALEGLHALLPALSVMGWGSMACWIGVRRTHLGAGGAGVPSLGWLLRSLAYLGLISAVTIALRLLSSRQDRDGDPRWSRARDRVACGALPVVALCACLAGMDWLRAYDPFTSSIFGPLMVSCGVLSAVAAWAIAAIVLRTSPASQISGDHMVAVGRLLLTWLLIAGYLVFSQLVICWMGDLPAEATWWLPRLHGYLGYLGVTLLLLGGGAPLLALLSHGLKRRSAALGCVCGVILATQALMWWWTVIPSLGGGHMQLQLGDFAACTSVGLWSALAVSHSRRVSAMTRHVPGMAQGVAYREQVA